jgi:hypothetical protein
MSEQSGKSERSDRPPRSGSSGGDRKQGDSGTDLVGDLQRWLIRSSAKNMRRELEDQVRRTIGGQRPGRSDVWDVATTEIPPEVGEAPECQWCPICRAARRMRDTRPGLAGQLSGAGGAVATAVQDAISALDSLLTKPGGRDGPATGGPDSGSTGPDSGGTRADTGSSPGGPAEAKPGGAAGQQPGGSAEPTETTAVRPDSLAGEHGQVGWKSGDRLATAGPAAGDPWATVTDSDSDSDTGDDTGSGSAGDRSDGRGHGPSDRG